MEEFKLITNPSKYKPHYDTIIKAEYTEAMVKIIFNNLVAPHCKIGFILNGVKYYDESYDIRKNAKIQLFAEVETGYKIDFVYINGKKQMPSVIGPDMIIEYDTIFYVQESLREYYVNFTAAENTELTYHYDTGSSEVTRTLSGGEHTSHVVPHGTVIDVGYTVAPGYDGELRRSDVKTLDTQFIVEDEDIWLSTYAAKKRYLVHMKYPDEALLEVSYRDDKGEEHHYETGELADQSKITEYFYAEHGSELNIDVTTNLGIVVLHVYINDTTDIPNHSIYNLTSDISIQTIVGNKMQYMKINKSELCNNVVIYQGKRYDDRSATVAIRYGDYIHFDMTPKDSFTHYVKAVKINENEYPGLESYQVLEDIIVDSVAGENIYPKATLTIEPVEHGKIKVFYIDKEYTAEDTPMDILENYLIRFWIEADEGYKPHKLYITVDGNTMEVPVDSSVVYKVTGNINISGEVIVE